MLDGSLKLDPWFIHQELLLQLLPAEVSEDLVQRLSVAEGSFAHQMRYHQLGQAAATYLSTTNVPSLELERLRGTLVAGQLVWVEQAIAFRGLSAALQDVRRGGTGNASFSAKLRASDEESRITGTFNVKRLTSESAQDQLSGTKRQFILGYVQEVVREEVSLRPIIIATRWLRVSGAVPLGADNLRVWPQDIDEFAGIDFQKGVRKGDLAALRTLPEGLLERAFAEVLAEPTDSDPERFGLRTYLATISGEPVTAAVSFSRSDASQPMAVRDLGSNGEQVDLLAQTAADLLVVQHSHTIPARVLNMLKVCASNPQSSRRYMLIDGYDTLRILHHFGYDE